jgi:hypothetical protein
MDVTEKCVWPYFNALLRFLIKKFESKKLDRDTYVLSVHRNMWGLKAARYYVLVVARKPLTSPRKNNVDAADIPATSTKVKKA